MAYKYPVQVIKQSNKVATGTVIFLHGSGDTGEGVREWIKCLLNRDFAFPHLRVMFPTAPIRRYTPINGENSCVWFDRLNISPDVPEHSKTLNSMADELGELIKHEITSGIPYNQIIIGGFSMGGAMAIHMAYRFLPEIAGVFALSSFLNYNSAVYQKLREKHVEQKLPPLFMRHGEQDNLVPVQWGNETFKTLQELGVPGEFHSLKHTVHELKKGELQQLSDWINKIITPMDS